MHDPIYKAQKKPYSEDLNDLVKAEIDKKKKVMEEFHEGTLHSGSKKGPKVSDPKQAVAIAYSEERNAKKSEATDEDTEKDYKRVIDSKSRNDLAINAASSGEMNKGGPGSGIRGHVKEGFKEHFGNEKFESKKHLGDTLHNLARNGAFGSKLATQIKDGDDEAHGHLNHVSRELWQEHEGKREAKIAEGMGEAHRQMVEIMNQGKKIKKDY